MNRRNSMVLAGSVLVLIVAAHGVAAWTGITLTRQIGGWWPWIAGGGLAFGLYHVVQAFGFYHVVRHIRSAGQHHPPHPLDHDDDRENVEQGPHRGFLVNLGHGFVEIAIVETDAPPRFQLFFYDKHRQARAVPRNANVRIETIRADETRETFEFQGRGEYLESVTEVAEPHEFKAVIHVSHGSHTHTHEVLFGCS